MATRTRSIRLKIFALLLLPLASLAGLWGFATSVAFGDAIALRNYETLTDRFGQRAEALITDLAEERLQSVVWLSKPRAAGRGTLDPQRAKADATDAQLRTAATTESSRALTPAMKGQLSAVFDQLSRLDEIRSNVDSRALDRLGALRAYNDVIAVTFRFIDSLAIIDHAVISQQAQAVNTAGHARELIDQENALIAGAAVSQGRLTEGEHTVFAGLVANQRYLSAQIRSRLTVEAAAPYERLFTSNEYSTLTALESQIVSDGGRDGTPLDVDFGAWELGIDTFAGGLDEATAQSRTTVAKESSALGDELLLRLGLAGGVGLLAVLISVLLLLRFGRRITRELVGLEEVAHELAGERLPRVVERLREGGDVDVPTETPLVQAGSTTEVGNIARAFSMVQRTAIEAAVGQAELRRGVGRVFLNLARRNQSLLHRQLSLLDSMERKATDPDELAELFHLDHLTTRMRRHAEGLIILSGAAPGRGWRTPVRVIDVMRGAVAEVEDYTRVDVRVGSRDALVGTVVADVIHLLAELVENATAFSSPDVQVEMRGEPVAQGFAIEIEDRGLGLSDEKRDEINKKLATPPEFDPNSSDQLGLFVVGRLAIRHGIQVSLRAAPYGGTVAIVLLPRSIVVSADEIDAADTDAMGGIEAVVDEPADVEPSVDAAAEAGERAGPETIGPTGRHRVRSTGPEPPTPQPASFGVREPEGPTRHPDPDPTRTDADTYLGLPRRRRQASLAPELRMDAQAVVGVAEQPDFGADPEASGERSPEEARSLLSSMQQGWRRGRAADGPDQPEAGSGSGSGSDDATPATTDNNNDKNDDEGE
jgi:signal transduction histidine kinase